MMMNIFRNIDNNRQRVRRIFAIAKHFAKKSDEELKRSNFTDWEIILIKAKNKGANLKDLFECTEILIQNDENVICFVPNLFRRENHMIDYENHILLEHSQFDPTKKNKN